jgi:phage terminase large subunit-like protein
MFGTADVRFEELMGTGAIPKAAIISVEKDGAAIKSAKIKHCPDGDYENWVNTLDNVSTIEFRSCEQGEATMMGSTVEVIWLDEEHPLHSTPIYAQCITRTATTGGIVIITATPENGLTELIGMFQDTPELYIQNATWDDAPHLDEKTKAELLAALPEWQHDMRSKGIPVMGEGLVYSVAQKTYECEPFEIPMHWKQIAALDVGYAHPTVFSKLAFDPDNDIIYLTYQQGFTKMTPSMIAPTLNTIGRGLPIVWPQDANQASKDTGITLSLAYENLGVALLPQPFKNRGEGSISVEYGVNEILERMKSGRFKVFSHCKEFFTGAQRYQRKDGVINKKAFDFDFGDSARYGALSDFEDWVTGYVKMQNSPLAWSSDSEWDDDSNMNDDHF